MSFIIEDTLQYPFYDGDLILDPDKNWAVVHATIPPQINHNEIVEEITPIYKDGKWFQSWSVRLKTAEELAIESSLPKFLIL